MTPSQTPLRLLFLTPFPPRLDGAHGGSRVIAQLLERLAERHHVGLICLRHPTEPSVDDRLRSRLELDEEVERTDHERSHGSRALRRVRDRLHVVAGAPLWATSLNVREFRRRLSAVLGSWGPDLVQIQYTAMGVYAPEVEAAGRPVVLWEPDPATNAAIELGQLASGNRLLRRLDVRAWRRFERKVLGAVDAAVVFTERDARVLAQQASREPVVIPFGTDFTRRTFVDRARDGDVLFVGNFVHPPNIDAARRLVRDIFPLVHARHPDTTLHVVGDNPPYELRAASNSVVNVTGRVPDPVPYVEQAAVVAAPIRFGGGMRVKVLEALAAGKPLVATALAVEGLDVADGDQFLAAETDEEFADRISALLADRLLRERLGRQARVWAEANLSWEGSVEAYEDLYARLLRAPRRPADTEPGLA